MIKENVIFVKDIMEHKERFGTLEVYNRGFDTDNVGELDHELSTIGGI